MTARHVEVIAEEPSMEAFIKTLLPRLLPGPETFAIHSFGNKSSLLKKLPNRLRGYSRWLPEHYRIVVIVDRDADDCRRLKLRLEWSRGEGGPERRPITRRGPRRGSPPGAARRRGG